MKRKKHFSAASLRLLLVAVVLAAFLPALGLVLYTGLSYQNYVVSSVRSDALQSTRLVAGIMDDLVEGSRILLITLSKSERVRSGDPAGMNPLFAALLAELPQYANIGAIHTDGTIFASGVPMNLPLSASDFPYFQRVMQKRDFAGGDYQVGRIVGKPVLIFAYPVMDPGDQEIRNVIYASLDLDYINQVAASQPLPAGAVINMVDRNGTLLVRQPEPDGLLGQTLPEQGLVRAMLGNTEGVVETAGLDGISRIYSFTVVGGTDDNVRLSIGVPRGEAYAAANRTLLFNLVLLGIVALLALGGDALFSEMFILRRVRKLVAATDRLAGGDLSARTGIPEAAGELGRLAVSFDAMAEALQRRNAELEEQARKMQDFLDIAGHELRHPITIISGYIQALAELGDALSPEEVARTNHAVRASVDRLMAIVDDLLDVSRIQSGRFPMRIQEVDVAAVLRGAIEEMERKYPAREFAGQVDPAMGAIAADPTRLHQVLVILLDNAVSYAPAGTPVELTAERRDEQVFVCCMDRGPGIPEEARERIFERFGQVADADHHVGGGLGVGLYIARRIAEAHGGSLTYEPREGGGSLFCLVLPVQTPTA